MILCGFLKIQILVELRTRCLNLTLDGFGDFDELVMNTVSAIISGLVFFEGSLIRPPQFWVTPGVGITQNF